MRDKLLIVHSREDEIWALHLLTFLKPVVDESRITHWVELGLSDGAAVPDNFKEALSTARIAVFLLSADFLASPLMCGSETESLLDAAARDGAYITWVVVSACAYKASPLMIYQAMSNPREPLDSLKPALISAELVPIAERVAALLEDGGPGAPGREQHRHPPAGGPVTSASEAAGDPARTAPGGNHTFICYAREDSEFVLALASDLKSAGVNVWLDQWDIPRGADWDYEIDKALYDCRHFLIVLSPEAVDSEEVRGELRAALNERKRVVPVLYKACRIPRRLTLIQHTDFTRAGVNRGALLKQIVEALGIKNP